MKSRYDNEMELQFVSKSRNEAFARITVAAFAAQLDPTIEELADIKTAVSEAVTNCIVHAYEDTEGIVKLRATLLDNVLEIEISDNGKGIEDVELARKPLYTTKGNLERSGMGFTIMESFMDEIEIHSVVGIGTKVVMKKRIKKEDKIQQNVGIVLNKKIGAKVKQKEILGYIHSNDIEKAKIVEEDLKNIIKISENEVKPLKTIIEIITQKDI